MFLKRVSLLFILWSIFGTAQGQERFSISGNITDADNGEGLIGATVLVKELNTGGVTNEYGFYSLTLPRGEYTLAISYVGYETFTQSILLDQNRRLNHELTPQSSSL